MSLVLDLILIAVIAISAYISARHGFVRTMIEFLGFITAVVIAFSVSVPLASVTYDKFIEPSIVKSTENIVIDSATGISDDVWNSLPSFIVNNAQTFGITKDSINNSINDNLSVNASEAVLNATRTVIKPIFTKFIGYLYSFIIIIILMIVVRFIAKILNGVFSISIIGKLNRILGAVFGGLKGIIFAFLLCMIIFLLVSFSTEGFFIFTREAIDKSYLFKFLTSFNPIVFQ